MHYGRCMQLSWCKFKVEIIVTHVASSSIPSPSSFSITSKLVHPDSLQLPQATCRAFHIVLLACAPHIATVSYI